MHDADVEVGDLPSLRSALQELAADSDLTGVELLRRVCRAANLYDTILNRRLRASDLSGPRWHLLMHLRSDEMRHGPGGVSPTYLSKCQGVRKNTISSLLRGLEEQGLIERALDPTDWRAFRIRLSSAGREWPPYSLGDAAISAVSPSRADRLRPLAGACGADRRTAHRTWETRGRALRDRHG